MRTRTTEGLFDGRETRNRTRVVSRLKFDSTTLFNKTQVVLKKKDSNLLLL